MSANYESLSIRADLSAALQRTWMPMLFPEDLTGKVSRIERISGEPEGGYE